MSSMVADEAIAPEPVEARNLGHDAWARWLARSVDFLVLVMPATLVVSALTGFVGGLVYPPLAQTLAEATGIWRYAIDFAFGVVAACLVETVLISAFGGTPGKALMGVKVAKREGGNPSLPTAAKRYFLVLVFGRGLSLPLISLMTLASSYHDFTEHGVTSWDDMLELEVKRHRVGWWRWALAILAYLLFTGLAAVGTVMEMVGAARGG